MSTLASAALVLICIWLGVLTLVVVLLVRQIGLLTVRLSVAGESASSVDDDGPEVGSSLPEEVASVLPVLEEEERAYLLLTSANCTPCRELVADLDGRHFEQKIVALVPGHEEMASELAALLPSGIRTVLDPQATDLAEALDLESTPFVLEIERETVTRKAYLDEGASDFIEFVESGGARAEKKSFVEITEKEASEGR
jgi:hypothetical protein